MPQDTPSHAHPLAQPWPELGIARYTAYRTPVPLTIDGNLDEPVWEIAPRSPRFRDLVSGGPAIHNTQAAVLWDDEYLYVGYWVEEPVLAARHATRDALIYEDNDVELFVAGPHAYYELEINALGTIYEALFVWEDAYSAQGFDREPGLGLDVPGYRPWAGVDYQPHPRGPRHGFFQWDLPGLRWAVAVDGVVNDPAVRDRGWTVEIAVPWSGLAIPARGMEMPPAPGDVWRMDFSRFNQYKAAPPSRDSGGWAWSPHGVWDSHVPEVFPYITFSGATLG